MKLRSRIPVELYGDLERLARAEYRSVDGQVRASVDAYLRAHPRLPQPPPMVGYQDLRPDIVDPLLSRLQAAAADVGGGDAQLGAHVAAALRWHVRRKIRTVLT